MSKTAPNPDATPRRKPRRNGLTPTEFAHRVTIAAVICLSLAALALIIWYSVQVLFLIFAGVLIAILLSALADLVEKWTGLGHRWSLAIVLVASIGIIALSCWLIFPPLEKQMEDLAGQFQPAMQNLKDKLSSTRLGHVIVSHLPSWDEMMAKSGGVMSGVGGAVYQVFDVLLTLLVVFFTAMFLAFDPQVYIRGTLRLVPPTYRERAGEVMGAIGYTLKWWLIGQAVAMVVIGLATWLGLMALGVKMALALGFLAAIFNFVPNFGPLFSAVPAILIALMDSPEKALWVVGLFVVLQNAEGYLISPNIQRKAVELPQALSILGQVMMGLLAGGIGFVLATPLVAAVHVAVKTLYVEDLLGDDVETPADEKDLKEIQQIKEATEDIEQDRASDQ